MHDVNENTPHQMSLRLLPMKRIGVAAFALAMASLPQSAWAQNQVKVDEATLRATLDELARLRAEVATLRARVDASERREGLAQAQAAAQAATLAAQAAQTKADAVQAQLTQTQTQLAQTQQSAQAAATTLASAAPAAPAAKDSKPGWWENTSIGGRAFMNFSHFRRRSDGATVDNSNGFQIKRLYLTLDHKFDSTWSASVIADVDNVIGNKDGSPTGRGFYVKNAFLQAKLDPRLIIRAGAANLPWIPYVEGIYGFRYVEQTITDRVKYGTSADWGVHLLGDFNKGMFSYALSVVDGSGYRNPDATQSVDIEGRLSFAYKGINAAVGGYRGRLGKNKVHVQAYHRAERFNALLAYKDERFTVGGEYFYASNWNQVTSVPSDRGEGYSVFGSVMPIDKLSLFARYDWLRPRKRIDHSLTSKYFHAGIQYSVIKPIDISLVYKHASSRNGTLSTVDGNIGGTRHGNYNEIGVYTQFKF